MNAPAADEGAGHRAGDGDLGERIGQALRGRAVATAESFTVARVGQALSAVGGSGEWFRGSVLAYHRDVKYRVLHVPPGPVVTARTAEAMAVNVARMFDAGVSVATTGAAGPSSQDGADPGTVFVAWFVDGSVDVEQHDLPGGPSEVIDAAVRVALEGLLARLERRASSPPPDRVADSA